MIAIDSSDTSAHESEQNKMTRFHLSSPSEQLAAELRRRIRAGDWEGRLPGFRKLMADFGASRSAVDTAIAELIRSGDLESRGERRAPIPVRLAPAADGGTLLILGNSIELRGGGHREMAIRLMERLPPPVTQLPVADYRHQNLAAVVARILATGARRAVILDLPSEVADRLVEAGLRVVLFGSAGRLGKADRIYVDHETIVRGAFRHAFTEGHRRVSYPLWRTRTESIPRIRAWVADEYARAGFRHAPDFDLPLVESPEPASLHECLRALLRHTPPTALISANQAQWLATLAVLGESGKRIPRDISHIALFPNAEWSALPTPQSHFAYPVAKLATNTVKLLRRAPGREKAADYPLPPLWVAGGTLGPPSS
jgi:DNA-binding LacI/PurR family transcriptional regulator